MQKVLQKQKHNQDSTDFLNYKIFLYFIFYPSLRFCLCNEFQKCVHFHEPARPISVLSVSVRMIWFGRSTIFAQELWKNLSCNIVAAINPIKFVRFSKSFLNKNDSKILYQLGTRTRIGLKTRNKQDRCPSTVSLLAPSN